MKLFDKLKNALFEEVEEVEEPKKEHKSFFKKPEEVKPIAKKVVIEDEEELDTKVPDEIFEKPLTTTKFNLKDKDEEDTLELNIKNLEDEEDFTPNTDYDFIKKDSAPYKNEPVFREDYLEQEERTPYGMSNKVESSIYGNVKEVKSNFRPSPILSPIYGVLDKNYKKEDIVTKKEARSMRSFDRENITIDDIRAKAYGKDIEDSFEEEEPSVYDDTSLTEEEKVVDLKNSKPEVKVVTVGDAASYFDDLGLEYNVDYMDSTKEIKKEEIKEDKVPFENTSEIPEIEKSISEKELEDDDNLFDLIDSMYKDKE